MMDAKYLAEIKARVEKDIPDIAAPVFRDRHDLIAEVERLNRLLLELKENNLDPVETAKVAMALNRALELRDKNAMLKKALDMMYADNEEYNPDGMGNPAYYIQQAQEGEEMKTACDKCLKVEESDRLKDWLRIRTDYSDFFLCPHCADGFWMAVDHNLPPVVKEATP